ncbi:MAG: redoxin domain-containing protein [Psittacicella sp.]
MKKIVPGSKFPDILVKTLDDRAVNLKDAQDNNWKLVVIYRGQHCPKCTQYLNALEVLKDSFISSGIEIIAVSADSKEQLESAMKEKYKISFPIAYGLSIDNMKALGVYMSYPRSPKESDHIFSEPAIFVINSEGNVQIIDISNIPFARPDFSDLLNGINFIRDPKQNYPIRGTFNEQ